MTRNQWVNSGYNNVSFSIEGGYLGYGAYPVFDSAENYVTGSDQIVANATYIADVLMLN